MGELVLGYGVGEVAGVPVSHLTLRGIDADDAFAEGGQGAVRDAGINGVHSFAVEFD